MAWWPVCFQWPDQAAAEAAAPWRRLNKPFDKPTVARGPHGPVTPDQAFDALRRDAGTRFDPTVVAALWQRKREVEDVLAHLGPRAH